MSFSTTDVRLIQESWGSIKEFKVVNAIVFYENLFKISPSSRQLFPEDLTKLNSKFTYTINFLVNNCDKLESIQESVEDLGRIHNKLNIPKEYYPIISDAIVKTIEKAMGENYSVQIGEAWERLINHMAEIMLNAPARNKNKFQRLLEKLFGK